LNKLDKTYFLFRENFL